MPNSSKDNDGSGARLAALAVLIIIMIWCLSTIFTGCKTIKSRIKKEGAKIEAKIDPEDVPRTEETNIPLQPVFKDDAIDMQDLKYLHRNISEWMITTTLDVKVHGGHITLDYDKKGVWPPIQNVVASAWVIFNYKGKWIAATFEYLKPGQTVKESGFWIPIDGIKWQPKSGETLYFNVSGLARDHRTNVEERSQTVKYIWP